MVNATAMATATAGNANASDAMLLVGKRGDATGNEWDAMVVAAMMVAVLIDAMCC
jgi:hypothetical protein